MPIHHRQVYPTGECFNDALDFIGEVLTQNPDDRDALVEELLLVHGILLGDDDRPYAHAWVEDTRQDLCIFCGILDGQRGYFAASRDEYYAEQHVQEVSRYSLREARDHNRRTGHCGPWKTTYRVLCKS